MLLQQSMDHKGQIALKQFKCQKGAQLLLLKDIKKKFYAQSFQPNTKTEMQENKIHGRKVQLQKQMPVEQILPAGDTQGIAVAIIKGKISGELPSVYFSNRKTSTHFKERGIFTHSIENYQLTLTFVSLTVKTNQGSIFNI